MVVTEMQNAVIQLHQVRKELVEGKELSEEEWRQIDDYLHDIKTLHDDIARHVEEYFYE